MKNADKTENIPGLLLRIGDLGAFEVDRYTAKK
jgi:hypothetical protein